MSDFERLGLERWEPEELSKFSSILNGVAKSHYRIYYKEQPFVAFAFASPVAHGDDVLTPRTLAISSMEELGPDIVFAMAILEGLKAKKSAIKPVEGWNQDMRFKIEHLVYEPRHAINPPAGVLFVSTGASPDYQDSVEAQYEVDRFGYSVLKTAASRGRIPFWTHSNYNFCGIDELRSAAYGINSPEINGLMQKITAEGTEVQRV